MRIDLSYFGIYVECMNILDLINSLEAEAARLNGQAKKLVEAAMVLRGDNNTSSKQSVSYTVSSLSGSAVISPNRMIQLKDFLKSRGAMKTGEIIKGSEIPRGTVSALLREENGFIKDSQGRWNFVE